MNARTTILQKDISIYPYTQIMLKMRCLVDYTLLSHSCLPIQELRCEEIDVELGAKVEVWIEQTKRTYPALGDRTLKVRLLRALLDRATHARFLAAGILGVCGALLGGLRLQLYISPMLLSNAAETARKGGAERYKAQWRLCKCRGR